MRENNNHILAQAIQDLPVHHPEGFVWDKLETGLFQFPAHELPVYEPDAQLWGKIENTLTHPKTSGINYRKSGLLLLALLFITLIGFNGYQQHHEINSPIVQNQAVKEPDHNKFISAPLTNNNNSSDQAQVQEVLLTSGAKASSLTQEPQATAVIDQANLPEQELKNGSTISQSVKHLAFITFNQNIPKYFGDKMQASITPLSSREGLLEENNRGSLLSHCVDTECSPFSGNVPYFSLGIFCSTAQFIDGNTTHDTKLSSWMSLELDLTYHRGRLFFVTGLGTVFSNDEGNITFNYLQNELVESYIYVDSVYYDPVAGTTQYYTTTVDVYDSIEYSAQSQCKKQYQYIKIPFRVGYKVYSNRHLEISLSGGISWIHQINTYATIPVFNKENARILQTHFDEVTRNEELFQLSAQLEFNFKLSQQIHIQLGPSINYFTQPLYQNQEAEKPISWSIRTGIQYNF